MTFRYRIAAAVAAGVTCLVIVMAGVGYFAVRSHLRNEIDHTLAGWGRPFTAEEEGPPRPARRLVPGPAPFGGASGYFQFVHANGTAFTAHGPALLPYGHRALQIARTGKGSFYVDESVLGTHLRVLTVADPDARLAVQIARPVTEVDSVLHDLFITYGIVVVVGIILALLLGARLGRVAIAPVVRFTKQAASVTGTLDGSERLEAEGVPELVLLAASFNRTLDALESSARSQKDVLADASHELRTPIAALRSNIQILLDAGRLPPDEMVALRDSIIRDLDELTQMISNVVELARDSDRPDQTEILALDGLVTESVLRARRRFSDIDFELDVEPTNVEHSPDRLDQLLSNLLSNAAKWSPPGGVVSVTLRDGTLTVRDHGSGFSEADLPFVFERFYRSVDARRLPGSGLGLAIVRRVAEQGGGSVEALNAPDGGAIVRVRFVTASLQVATEGASSARAGLGGD